MDSAFLNKILEKISDPSADIIITDNLTRILAATRQERIGRKDKTAGYIISIARAASIDDAAGADSGQILYGAPILDQGQIWGTVVVSGPSPSAAQHGVNLKTAIETALEYAAYAREKASGSENELQEIAQMMLTGRYDADRLYHLMNRHEMDPGTMRTVICVRLDYYHNSYFNINLNLGYQSSIDQLHEEAIRRLKKSRYLNSQDLIYNADRNSIVIIKSFLPTNDLPRTYLALDIICKDFSAILETFSAFDYSIAYGNLYSDIGNLKNSRHEAEDIIAIGKQSQQKTKFYSLDTLLFESVCRHLHPQVVNKMIEPAMDKLRDRKGELPAAVLESCEAYIDCCMNLSDTSARTHIHRNTINQRIEKLKSLTGLDPRTNFNDAFLVKMICVYLRLNPQGPAPDRAGGNFPLDKSAPPPYSMNRS